MRKRLTTMTTIALLGGGIAVACGGDEREPMTPAARVATPVAPAEAADRIADARCTHEQRCGTIGETLEFQSADHCRQAMYSDAAQSVSDCESGIAESDLRECLTEISNEDCGGVASLFDNLDTYLSCRSLCLD